MSIHPVILCGGSGTRLWPRSRAGKPKPFLRLLGEQTLFEATLARCAQSEGFASPVILTGAIHLPHVEQQLGSRDDATIIVEPVARNTAAAIALAALRLPREAVMLVCPSDHHIADTQAFRAAAVQAATLAEDGWLVSIAIAPDRPETGFGYLHRGEAIGAHGFRTREFVEKPDFERACQFIADGNYAWNGGIFAFGVDLFLRELERHAPAIYAAATAAVATGHSEGRLFFPEADAFSAAPSISVDYAVMELTEHKALVPADMGWTDIGSWDSLHAAKPVDAAGNSVSGPAELVDCQNVLVDSDGPRVSVIGLEKVIVVVDGDEVLVTTRDGAQRVGKLAGAVNQ